ncbi:MAG: glycosyltransferase family A protein [Actinomycetota bacterium]|nr:glycosyltransferase family A protein [Actinomycetota bacterium]
MVVTPVRDEAALVGRTIDSVAAQELRPAEWVLVDDGSTDGTAAVLDRRAAEHDWIRVVHRADRGARVAGSGVMEAFHAGLEVLETADWHYLVKLDADLVLPPDYFSRCLARAEADPGLGVVGGLVVDRDAGAARLERHPGFHVRGATKIYARACWEAIGGTVAAPGWDTLDEVTANHLGWRTRTFDDVVAVQQRLTGGPVGRWNDVAKNGRASYRLGYHPAFVLARAVRKLSQPPRLTSAAALVWGYASAALTHAEPVGAPEVRRYLRRQQLDRLRGRPSIWR